METSAKVILDSVSIQGHRLTTMEVTLHRFVLAEFNTHRVFSRNSASSRAIPVEKQLTKVLTSPAWPLEWPCEQPGMQGGAELQGDDLDMAQALTQDLHELVTERIAIYLREVPEKENRLHKSVINRYMEPFMWHTILVTSTEWANFFNLRCSPLAQPEIRVAAELMLEAYEASTPRVAHNSYWHMPYIDDEDRRMFTAEDLRRISTGRCARVSLLNHGKGTREPKEDIRLCERLCSNDPKHASPLEHIATPMPHPGPSSRNYTGWRQYRAMREYQG